MDVNQQRDFNNEKGNTSKSTVLVGGCFDILHYGHIYFLSEAKKLGEKLTVLLESDETIKKNKGEGRPFHTQQQRKMMLESLHFVDEVISLPVMNGDDEYFLLIQKIQPDIIAYTDGDPLFQIKVKQAETVGARPVAIPKIETSSTTALAKLLSLE